METVKRYQELLPSGDVVCGIWVPNDGGVIAGDFWQHLCREFSGVSHNRLIVVMAGELKPFGTNRFVQSDIATTFKRNGFVSTPVNA